MSVDPVELLKELAHRYHHFKQENKHKGPVSSRNRQHQQLLRQLEESFEKAVDRWVEDDNLHDAWLAHFYHFTPTPRGPTLPTPPVFKGRDPNGRSAELIPSDGAYELVIEGKPVRRIASSIRLPERRLRLLRVGGSGFEEIFDAPKEAQEALGLYTSDPTAGAPWKYVTHLYSDGIVDPNFGLTPRGRRLIDLRKGGRKGGVELSLS